MSELLKLADHIKDGDSDDPPDDGYAEVTCYLCTISFYVTTAFDDRRRNDHLSFYCPVGHSQWYPPDKEKPKGSWWKKLVTKNEA